MITRIHTPEDAVLALNENLEGLLTGKRKVAVVKEVHNNVGKHLEVYKLEAQSKYLAKDNTPLSWFAQKVKEIENT